MSAALLAALRQESFFTNRAQINEAESAYAAKQSGAKVDNLAGMTGQATKQLSDKVKTLETENAALKKVTDDLKALVIKLEKRVDGLEGKKPAAGKPSAAADDDDDVDLFGSGDEAEESEDKKRITEERLAAYHAKKAKKPTLIAKTSVLLDVKPWDDETDMDAMLKMIKTIAKDGLVWGASKLVPVGYGINKLQILCVVEDEKVSIDELQEQICEFEDFVQSVDVAAMSKI
jgi:elongation factor 1-delta